MIDGLERALRDEFAARAAAVPVADDIAETVIIRAKRTRRRRRLVAGAAAVVMVVATGTSAVWAFNGGDVTPSPDQQAAGRADGLSTLVRDIEDDSVDFVDGDGKRFEIEMSAVYEAWEVEGGWLFGGDRLNGGSAYRYVATSGEMIDIGEEDGSVIYPSQRGDGLVQESFEDDDSSSITIYNWSDTEPPSPTGSPIQLPGGYMVGGMVEDEVWLTADNGDETQLATMTADADLSEVVTDTPVEPLKDIANGRMIADISTDGDKLCPAVVDPANDFAVEASGDCYQNSVMYSGMVVTSPDGTLAMAYVDDSEAETQGDEGTGEWMWVDLSMKQGFTPTDHGGFQPPTINANGDAIFADTPGSTIGDMNAVIPRLGG